MSVVHLVVPDGVDDPARPSGGNTYDRQLCAGLVRLGRQVRQVAVAVEWRCGQAVFGAAALADALARVPTGAVVVVDGLVASAHPSVLEPESGRLRLVVLVHLPLGLGDPDGGAGDRREIERAALRCVAAVVTTSRWTRRWLLDAYGLDPARVVVAVPGVEAAQVVDGSPGGRRLLCVGAVVPAKGHDVLLEALARVSVRDWGCEWAGSLERDPVFVDRLRARAADLGVADRVRLSGPLVGGELESAYAGCDLLVTASRGETYGMVVTEALARGIPVLATRVGGLPEALGRAPDGRRPGILVPPGDAGACAGALEQWFGDPALRAHLRAAARDRRPLLPTWATTSAVVSGVLTDVAA